MVTQKTEAVPGRVSVIMNCLNGERYLREAIDSVYLQDYPDWEIVFWDNSSTDDSAVIAQSYDDRLRYLTSEEIVPLGEARNRAMKEASGEFIAFLDSDDIWLPGKLSAQVPLFENSRVGLVYTDVVSFDQGGCGQPKYGNLDPPQGQVFERFLFNNFVCMSTAIVRTEAIKGDDIWFDPRFSAVEDTDLFTRIARTWHFAYAPGVLCQYRMHDASISSSLPMLFRDECELMLEKYIGLFPEFAERYQQRCKDEIDRDRALVEWRSGNRNAARKHMLRLATQDWRHRLTYLAMHLPYQLVEIPRRIFLRRAGAMRRA
jgi:glycosyltransferase involved in cell wall biosynthesis